MRDHAQRCFPEHMLTEGVGGGQREATAFGGKMERIRQHPRRLQPDHARDRYLIGVVDQFRLASFMPGRFRQAVADIG